MTRLKLFFLLCFLTAVPVLLTGCVGSLDDNEELDEEDPSYVEVRKKENERVSSLLQRYAKGGGEGTDDSPSYDRLNIAFMTDSHIDMGPVPKESRRNLRDAIDFCNASSVPIELILHGGDAVTQIASNKKEHFTHLNKFFEIGWQSKIPFLYTKGNHDINTVDVHPSLSMTDSDWNSIWYDRAEQKYGIVRNNMENGQKSGYYYYDLEKWKVRIISVDCFDVDISKTNSSGNVLYWGGSSQYVANEQLNWIANRALNFDDKSEKDWGVIVFTHFYRPSNIEGSSVEPKYESVYKKFNSMLSAFDNQESFSVNYLFYPNNYYNISLDVDWTRYSNLDKKPYIICVLSGHLHTDNTNNWDGIWHFVTANQFCGEEYSDPYIERLPGTRSQNLFDIVNIDLKERKLRVIRYGASANLDGQEGNRFLKDGLNF